MATSPFLKFGGGGGFPFTNDYLLKHGNFFMKPTLHPDGFMYPALSEQARYQVYRDTVVKCEPLDFAVKQEKPPTPPASASPTSPPASLDPLAASQLLNGQSKSVTWILGKQKLSWDNSTVASYNPETKMFRCVVCNAVGFLSRIAEHYLGTHTSAKVFQCLHCPYSSTWSRCVRMHMAKHHGVPNAPPSLWKGQPLLEEIFQLLTNLKTAVDSQGRERLDPEISDKKFVCPKCPYTTDRRDLYMRHENIHKEDKPYHCYVCFKLFNRADHVKKHFLRIHRGHPYDISLVRRRPPRIHSSAGPKQNSNNFTVDKLIAEEEKDEVIDLSSHRSPSPSQSEDAGKPQLKTFQCDYCEWEGVDGWCLRRHMNVHLKSFECPICDFKVGKAEKLFTHVYRNHKKLVCTKCKFMTHLAQDFELHIKDCCVEIVVGSLFDKISEDSPTESDDASPDNLKFDTNGASDQDSVSGSLRPYFPPNGTKFLESMALDLKNSVSLMPLHNSISYCYPGTQCYTNGDTNGVRDQFQDPFLMNGNGLRDALTEPLLVNGNAKPSSRCKVEMKSELASPVQSSSDSGVTDLASDNNSDQDITCWQCGCEFADHSSLHTHTELHHRPPPPPPPPKKPKKFSCAICNFHSDRQRTIIEHMRYHTGEVLHCRACAFETVCDSALEEHVRKEHDDGSVRCPHCGCPCSEKVPFIRHYRKCHHSKSCLRCRYIKRSLDPKLKGNDRLFKTNDALFSKADDSDLCLNDASSGDLSSLLKTNISSQPSREVVKPYLHHNPYSKKANGFFTPYAHCNAAMSKVAVSIPQSLQALASLQSLQSIREEKKSRKQSSPRKLLLAKMAQQRMSAMRFRSGLCAGTKGKKLLKTQTTRRCRLNHQRAFNFRNNVNYARHLVWHHFAKKHRCGKCSQRFMHRYRALLHSRREHEGLS